MVPGQVAQMPLIQLPGKASYREGAGGSKGLEGQDRRAEVGVGRGPRGAENDYVIVMASHSMTSYLEWDLVLYA